MASLLGPLSMPTIVRIDLSPSVMEAVFADAQPLRIAMLSGLTNFGSVL